MDQMIELNLTEPQKKKFEDGDLVCFCFGYKKIDIKRDYSEHGRSTIMERITREKQNNGCECAVKNPSGH